MKKCLCLVFCLALLLNVSSAVAADMGVQIIGGPEMEAEPVSLDDFKLNVDVPIDGYAILKGTNCEFVDWLGCFNQGADGDNWYNDRNYYNSGNEADYLILRMDILNTMTKNKNFLEKCEVKVVYDELYEYGGWFHQYNYNNKSVNDSADGIYANKQNTNFVIHKADVFTIKPMYQGHYCFGCTLPNAVTNSKAPLKMIINIDGHEITYNIRK